jgi:hypothetical protein
MESSNPDNQIGGFVVSTCGFLAVISLELLCPLNPLGDLDSMDR